MLLIFCLELINVYWSMCCSSFAWSSLMFMGVCVAHLLLGDTSLMFIGVCVAHLLLELINVYRSMCCSSFAWTSLMFIGVCVAHLFSCMCFCCVHPSYVYCAQCSYKCPSIVHCPFPLTFVFIQKSTWLGPIMLSEFVTFQMFDEIVACQ